MKRKGFTLLEILIAVGIIGVIAAIMGFSINDIRPDKTKIAYLNAYDSLSSILESVIKDSSIYSPIYVTSYDDNGTSKNITYNLEKYPLLNISQPISTKYSNVRANQYKLANILRVSMNATGSTCSSTAVSCTYTSNNNVVWSYVADHSISKTSARFADKLNVTINGSTFNFIILGDGTIVPTDVKGQSYIKFRNNVRSQNDNTAGLSVRTCNNLSTVEPKYLNTACNLSVSDGSTAAAITYEEH